ncbi:MAG: alanine--tRNA ligase [Acidobacteriia bacterium]|nr:alanine--tRNA ligase [Terriglobia bacterium]
MTANEIRTRFLDFFASRGHRVVPSSSLVPANDPTLLFSNAGMNQFKEVFLGRERRDYTRACSSQKCVRAGGKHNDLEQVGRTTRHHTFFEMLGNFSFGDYFKKEAIPWAWELITKDFAIPRDKLYVTIFLGSGSGPEDHDLVPHDDEAHDLWVAQGVGNDRILELGLKDNFWQMGDTGPCGPCSEIHYDLGPGASDLGHTNCKFPCDCGRFVEIWNLVFMQYSRYCRYERDGYPAHWDEKARADHKHSDDRYACLALDLLPKPCVDTGMGLERIAAVLQGKKSNYDTDLFRPLIDEAAGLANAEYGANHDADVSLRIIADHARAATFLISDGVLPSNEGRGYVLRLIMRRALYHGQTLGLNEPFLYKMAGHVVQMMKDAYPELIETEHHIAKAIKIEEERYAHTTKIGLERLDEMTVQDADGMPHTVRNWKREYSRQPHSAFGGQTGTIPGDVVFKLHDTFGLRPDFIEDIVKNYRIKIDRKSYEDEMQIQRNRARASWRAIEKSLALPVYVELAKRHKSEFLGYSATEAADCTVVQISPRGEDRTVEQITAGMAGPVEWEIVLDRTPFYGESGGQVGDTGWFYIRNAIFARVKEAYWPVTGVIAHRVTRTDPAPLRIGDKIRAVVDAARRDAIRRNHTATHLLHAALRKTLGTHVKQAGSLVEDKRLRFDFTHYAALDEQDLLDIEDLVNEHILKNEVVATEEKDLDSAVASGAMALFGEKYADKVRVLSIDDFSKELCGGTHVQRTGDIGLFKIVSESSVAAGTRRIEALTGTGVLEQMRKSSETLAMLSEAVRSKPDELLEAIEKLTESEKRLRKQLEAQQMKRAASEASDLVEQAREVKGVRVVAARVEVTDRSAMRQMMDDLRVKLQSGVIVLGSVADGKVSLIAAVTKDLTDKLDAGKIVKQAATYVEGSGGGRKDLAEAGGKNPAKLDESLRAVPGIIEQML